MMCGRWQMSKGLNFLVPGSTDRTVYIRDLTTATVKMSLVDMPLMLLNTLSGHKGAFTYFQHDEIQGMWNVQDGTFSRHLLTDVTSIFQVAFEGTVSILMVVL